MVWTAPVEPVSGTVITVAWARANVVDPIAWLRLMAGNADPPGSSYVVVSDSTAGTSWRKVPSDALAPGACTGVALGTEVVTLSGVQMLTNKTLQNPVVDGSITTRAGLTLPAFTALANVNGGGGWTFMNNGSGGFGLSLETPQSNSAAIYVLRLLGATRAIYLNSDGSISAGGTITSSGTITGGDVVASDKLVSHTPTGAAPIQVDSTTVCANLNADMVDGRQPGLGVSELAFYDAQNRVYDSARLEGLTTGTAPGRIPVYDANTRVFAAQQADTATHATSADNVAGYTPGTAAGRLAVYDTNTRVYDSARLEGLTPGTAGGRIAVYDANTRVYDSARLEGLTTGTAPGRIPVYDANTRVFAAQQADTATHATSADNVAGYTPGTAAGRLPVYDASTRVYDSARLNGAQGSASPTANAVPIAGGVGTIATGWLQDITHNQIASGNLDGATNIPSMRTLGSGSAQAAAGNHTHAGGSDVPAGLIAAFPTAAQIASGWTRYTAADGRLLIGAGTSFSVTWTENQSYGSSWGHDHGASSASASSTFSGAASNTGNTSSGAGTSNGGSGSSTVGEHTHPFTPTGTIATTLSGTVGNTTWLPPTRCVVWAQKT